MFGHWPFEQLVSFCSLENDHHLSTITSSSSTSTTITESSSGPSGISIIIIPFPPKGFNSCCLAFYTIGFFFRFRWPKLLCLFFYARLVLRKKKLLSLACLAIQISVLLGFHQQTVMINGDEKFEKLWAKPRLNSSNRFIVTVVHLIWLFGDSHWWHGKDEINLPMLHWLNIILLTKIIDSNDDDIHYLCFVDLIDSNWIFFSLFTFEFYQILTRWLPGLYHFKSINDDDDWLSSKRFRLFQSN